jgi:hypothetical protein
VAAASVADAAVLCASKKKGAVFLRTVCKKKGFFRLQCG